MMKRLLIMVGAAAVLAMSSCSKEELVNDGPGVDGHRVSLTLNGSARMVGTQAVTRTASGGTVTGTLAALDKEKKVSSLLAVAFYKSSDEKNGKLYKVFEVSMSGDPNFDMESAGVFDVWFVANADETLAGLIKKLTPETSTADDLGKLVGSQAPDTQDQFLMVSVDSKEIRTNDGATTKVTVTMRRASARFDIINAIDGITVTKVKFDNRATNTQIATPNTTTDFSTAAFEDKEYTVSLTGNGQAATGQGEPAAAKCEAQIYSYENVNDDENNRPKLELTYKVDVTGVEKTHTVEFADETGELQIKRNYLYRIILNEKHSDMTVACKISVAEWDTAEEFVFEELPFDKNLNAGLLVNRFAAKNVNAAGLNTDEFSFVFSADNAAANSAYAAFSDDWATKKYTDEADVHGTQYRVPTVDEWMLLLPKKKSETTNCPFVCFAENKMITTSFNETVTIGGTQITGSSTLKYNTNDQVVYALRFMGSDQAAAYRYAFADNALSIKVIALGKDSKTGIDDVQTLAWTTQDKYIEVKLPAGGYYASTDTSKQNLQETNTNGYYWSASADSNSTNNAWAVSFNNQNAAVTLVTDKGAFYTLRPISDYDTPVLK